MKIPPRLIVRPRAAVIVLGATALASFTGGAMAGVDSAARLAEKFVTPGAAIVARSGVHSSLSDMVESVGPSVVQIKVNPGAQGQSDTGLSPFGSNGTQNDSGFADRLSELFGLEAQLPDYGSDQKPRRSALGSGFIVDAAGLVITNNHVVDGADRVTVQLSDGRELPGRVLGRDPKIDIAVIRIEGEGNFKPISWGDSDHIRVGDSVFAVGSPFGLGNTVTSGIVSARGREIGAGPYDDFLQVDAAINSGNSGGPLFDGSGRVVGVNTAIFSPSGGNVGIGFAIPAKMARQVALQIASSGHVSRGRIGVSLQDMTPELAESIGMKGQKGALIAEVEGSGPGARAGLQRGDIVRSFGTTSIESGRDLARAVANAQIGSSVPLRVIRHGREMPLQLVIESDNGAGS